MLQKLYILHVNFDNNNSTHLGVLDRGHRIGQYNVRKQALGYMAGLAV